MKPSKTRKTLLRIIDWIADASDAMSSRSMSIVLMSEGIGGVRAIRRGEELGDINEQLRHLERRKFIEIKRLSNRLVVALTDKGRVAGLRENARSAALRTDHRLCLVSFDIPEQERGARLVLRRFLRECGFRMHHQSLWVSDRDIINTLTPFIRRLGIARWVHLYLAEPIVIDTSPDRSKMKRSVLIERKNELLPGYFGRKRFK
jgi:hypothetical protein